MEPDRAHLENGAQLNPHGYGWALASGELLLTCRTLMAREAVTSFLSARVTHPDSHAVFHSRYATGSAVNLENCHPFEVGNDANSVVFHNGFLFPVKPGERSDTAVFAAEILPGYDVKDPAVKADLEARMGLNKAVILSVNPASQPVTVLNEQLGITLDDGTWHSNADFLGMSHIVPGWCGSCGREVPGDGTLCAECEAAAAVRRALLMEDR